MIVLALYESLKLTTMHFPEIKNCPGTLAQGNSIYSRTCLKKLFSGKSVHHVLPYESPASSITEMLFEQSRKNISISGVQEKFSVILEKNKLRLVREAERGTYILKPIPNVAKNSEQMPANEHLTMQIASQVFAIETAQNALIFFKNGEPAYITKRFDVNDDGSKLAQDDFASLAGRIPQIHGENYKYLGNYFDLFQLMQTHLPAYRLEAPKLFKVLLFNYLFSNGDAHLKNFSILETPMGDYRLSPAYDLLNTHIHVNDSVFALNDGLLPRNIAKGKIAEQFIQLAQMAGINDKVCNDIIQFMCSKSAQVEQLVSASFLNDTTKRYYWQSYQTRLKQMLK
jgi:serine/threonine-protein kinase HipA